MQRFIKSPGDILDYGFDWSDWLAGDTIVSSSWTVPTGLTEDSQSDTATTTLVFVTGGTSMHSYILTNVITTADGRTAERSLMVTIRPSTTK